jgi:two-component system cell cycle response regulator CtrA
MRVLLIEDDSATAQSIELMLKSESFNVYTTDLGEEGVDLGKLYDYDIILLDLNLPDMSGYEVLRTLRLSKVKTPILILSGMAGIEDKVRGLAMPSRSSPPATWWSTLMPRPLRSVASACI